MTTIEFIKALTEFDSDAWINVLVWVCGFSFGYYFPDAIKKINKIIKKDKK